MTITEGMQKYRLPNPSTLEDLETNFSGLDGKVINFGDRVLVAGYFWNGPGKPTYFAAAYEYLDDEETYDCESTVGLRAVSEVDFEDDGHAIAWAMNQ